MYKLLFGFIFLYTYIYKDYITLPLITDLKTSEQECIKILEIR